MSVVSAGGRGIAVALELGRSLARAWVLQLLIGSEGKVIDFPDLYFELAEAAQGAPVPFVDAGRTPWGPPA